MFSPAQAVVGLAYRDTIGNGGYWMGCIVVRVVSFPQ